MNCPKCGESVPRDGRFCGKCGQQIDSDAGRAQSESAGPGASVGDFGLAAAGAGSDTGAAAAYPGAGAQALRSLIERIKNIVLTPKTEWRVIEAEPTSVAQLYTGYVMPMAAFAAAMSFIRISVIGVSLPFGGTIRTPLASGLVSSVVTFILGLLGLFLVGSIINMLAPTFAGGRNQRQALKTAAYALTPAWLGTALTFLPLGTLLQLIAGFYGIYVLYLGLPVMMRSQQDKAAGYTAAVVACTILVGILFAAAGAMLGAAGRMAGIGSAAVYESHSPEAAAAAADQAGAVLGNAIGGVLGTDEKGKEGLSNAFSNLAKAGQKIEQEETSAAARAASGASAGSAGSAAGADSAAGTTASGGANTDTANTGGMNTGGMTTAAGTAATTTTAATAAGSNSDPAQNAMAAAGGLLSALGGALGGNVRHEPVDFNTLKGMLPTSLPQMQRTDAEGSSQQALGVKSSSATAEYAGSNSAGSSNPHLRIKISDMSGVSGLLEAASGLAPTGERQTDTGFEKDMVVNGRVIHEKYDRKSGDGEVSALIARRFSVEVTGRGVDIAQLEKTLNTVDLARLESMKDAGAQAH
ncbi:MAG: Na+/proline symporter [Gammaproteobacteria bacterium]|nr:Na+/proline symporter [Gammaproteobacteria bacterium]